MDAAERRGEVGYWLLRPARGRGYATRAVELVCRWAFEQLGLTRLELLAMPDNAPSIRVAERTRRRARRAKTRAVASAFAIGLQYVEARGRCAAEGSSLMRAPPRLRGGLGTRVALLVVGLFLFAGGIVALLESRLGLAPWDVLHQGLARQTPLSFGIANIAVGLFVLAVAWSLGARIGVATVANAVLVGAFVELLSSLEPVAGLADAPLPTRLGLLVAGLALLGIGSGLYLGADLGAGPRDSLMVVGAQRTPLRIGLVRGGLELAALCIGFVLGGTVGVGTVAFALGIGPSVELSFWLLARSRLALDRPGHQAERQALDVERGRRCPEAWERA